MYTSDEELEFLDFFNLDDFFSQSVDLSNFEDISLISDSLTDDSAR
jgi:hypothetical protein